MRGALLNAGLFSLYLAIMVVVGWAGFRRPKNTTDYLLAGRNLGPVMYTSTLSAMMVGGGSTIGGVALGYEYGLAGMWFGVCGSVGVLVGSLMFAKRIRALKVFTVAEMLGRRYGSIHPAFPGSVMFAYAFLLAVTSTVAYSTVFGALFGLGHIPSVVLGGGVVVLYCVLGGMWTVTLNDSVQFAVKTVGFFFVLLPALLISTHGLAQAQTVFQDKAFDPWAMPTGQIVGYLVLYGSGVFLGQDVWQRVSTARTGSIAKWGGVVCALYCAAYGVSASLIGVAGRILEPGLDPNSVYANLAAHRLPVGLSAIVMAAAVSAMMSTSSGALIAAATVLDRDLISRVRPTSAGEGITLPGEDAEHTSIRVHRLSILVLGTLVVALAALVTNVLTPLSVAFDLLVGALFVPVFGGFVWRRANKRGALTAMFAGLSGVGIAFAIERAPSSNAPIYVGLVASLGGFAIGNATVQRATIR